jgi:hypothetical protein
MLELRPLHAATSVTSPTGTSGDSELVAAPSPKRCSAPGGDGEGCDGQEVIKLGRSGIRKVANGMVPSGGASGTEAMADAAEAVPLDRLAPRNR